jgi:membrane protease YdiL (CAAX protease family)
VATSASMPRAKQTALFLAIALGGSAAIGALWVSRPEWRWLTQYLMWTPGIAALILQWVRREAPRAMGFAFTGAGPWVAAFLYPPAIIAGCIALAYAIEAVTGTDVIRYQPDSVQLEVLGVQATGMDLVPLRLARSLLLMVPWLVLALAYRLELPEKLGGGRHLARAALWGGVFWFNPGPWWLPPGNLGEELGWRGWLVRVWRDRPLTALALTAAAWSSFHLPVIALVPPLQSFVPALSFLLSIAAAAAAFQFLYLWSGSIWPPVIAHFTWNFWNPFFLGSQYGPSKSIFGGELWLINGEGVLGMVLNGAVTLALVMRWRSPHASWSAPGGRGEIPEHRHLGAGRADRSDLSKP